MSGLTILDHAGPSPKQWYLAIRGMRQSWSAQDKSDSWLVNDMFRSGFTGDLFRFGPADRDLIIRLARAGDDHGKTLRQLPVIVEIKAPGYWWREFDTYKVGVEAPDIVQNSTSMMHTLGRAPLTRDDFAFDGLDESLFDGTDDVSDYLAIVERKRLAWIEAGKRKGPDAEAWRALQQFIAYSYLYTRTVSLNYQVLRSIYAARRKHRLAEWRDFCTFIEGLEYSELLTTMEAK